MRRIYGYGSVFGKSLRDARLPVVVVVALLGLLVLATIAAIGAEFNTATERQLLAQQMRALPPLFQGMLGTPIDLETLPGFLSWRLVGTLPVMVGLWSITALARTLAGEAANGSLEIVLASPVSRRRVAAQKVGGHLTALLLALAVVSLVASLGSHVFAALPGDAMSPAVALTEFALVAAISAFAGSIALLVSILFGSTMGVAAGAAYLFGSYAVNGFAGLVPGFDAVRPASVFYWTTNHRPMAGVSDWPAVVATVAGAAALLVVSIVAFERRDLGARAALPTPRRRGGGAGSVRRLFAGAWTLAGPGTRSLAERLPESVGWGAAMGLYGLFIALAADSFAEVINGVPQIAQMVRLLYPDVDFGSAGGVLQLATFTFIALVVGLAAAALVNGWSAEERGRTLEVVLSTHVSRRAWFVRSGAGVLLAMLVLGLIVGAMPALGAAIQGDDWLPIIAGGGVLGLYGAALAGVGLLVAGAGRPGLAAPAVAALSFTFYLLNLLGGLLDLPSALMDLSLTRHLGQPMTGQFNLVGMIASAVITVGGLLVGSFLFERRDLQG